MELTFIQKIAVWALPIIFAITLHEVAHGWIASFCGDQTARLSGRLTINPLKHIDMVGTVIVPLFFLLIGNFIFGWAKPVPVDARNMRHPRRDMVFVALAGPLANLLMAIGWALIARIGFAIEPNNPAIGIPLYYMGSAGITINVVLMVLNLLPLPPLDGGRVLVSLLPPRVAYKVNQLEHVGFLILMLLMVSGLLSYLVGLPAISLMNLIGHLVGLPSL